MADSLFGLVAAAASKLPNVLFHGTRDRVNGSGQEPRVRPAPLCQAAPLCVVPTNPPSSTPRASWRTGAQLTCMTKLRDKTGVAPRDRPVVGIGGISTDVTPEAVALQPIVGRAAFREFVTRFEQVPGGRLEIRH